MSKKRIRRGQHTWEWMDTYNEQEGLTDEERNTQRLGILRGKVQRPGEVVKVELYDCKLTGQIPGGLMSMLSLRVLILFQNEITSALPDFAALPCLEHIDLSYNKFTGGIPESIGQLAGLKQLHLEQNQLTGPIPDVFMELIELEEFTANDNMLSGPLPDFSNCLKLKELFLHNNFIDGTIPEDLALCKELEKLYLAKNCLTGALPNALEGGCAFKITPRSGIDLPVQAFPSKELEEVQKGMPKVSATKGYYDENEGYYDENGNYYDAWGNVWDPNSGYYYNPSTGEYMYDYAAYSENSYT